MFALENPHCSVMFDKNSPKINVWAAVSRKGIYRPIFVPGNNDQDIYLLYLADCTYYNYGTHLLKDHPSVELSSGDQLIHKIREVEEVGLLIDVPRNKNGPVDAFRGNCRPDIDLRRVFVKRDTPVWVLFCPLTVVLIKKIKYYYYTIL